MAEVEEIVRNAQQELALEKQYLAIEEDWTEQVIYMWTSLQAHTCILNFTNYYKHQRSLPVNELLCVAVVISLRCHCTISCVSAMVY